VSGYREDWRTWMLAAGIPDLVPAGSLTFDLTANALQAAADGAGLALGRTTLVEADMASGRLVAPFALTLPADAGFYLVAAEADADLPKIKVFREWLLEQAAKRRVDRPPAAPYVVSDE
jgi:LysR family glycine cleavage system transcriptional activator